MKHEKIITREDGTQVKIIVHAWIGTLSCNYVYDIEYSASGYPFSFVNYTGTDDATPEEILSAKMELWERLKPV